LDEIIDTALNAMELSGVQYGDVRCGIWQEESIEAKNSRVEHLAAAESAGVGVRVIVDGAWGFAAVGELTPQAARTACRRAVELGRASATVKRADVTLAEASPVTANYSTPHQVDPFEVSLDEKVGVLLAATDAMLGEPKVKLAQAFFTAFRTRKRFASTQGARINQTIIECGGGIAATAMDGGAVQVRSYPNSFRGNFGTGGYEYFESLAIVGQCQRISEEAAALLAAPDCPDVTTTVIIDGGQLALQIHESIGHPSELDRVLGSEASYAGTSFLKPEMRGSFRYGSELVNVVADATVPCGLGTFGFDDEGVPAQATTIIRDGIFEGFLSSRETAAVIGTASSGAMRAEGWHAIPLVRMTNVNLLPGTWRLEDLIADTEEGLLLSTNRSWSIDDKRVNFQFGTEMAQEIVGGRLGKIYRNATYTGITPRFWASCDAVCTEDYWQMWGTPNCGKGQPGQVAHVGHGTAPARFTNVRVRPGG